MPATMEASLLFLACLLGQLQFSEGQLVPACVPADGYKCAVDFYGPATIQHFNCLYQHNYTTVFLRAYYSGTQGSIDPDVIQSVWNAITVNGLGIQLTMYPNPRSTTKTAVQQFDEMMNSLMVVNVENRMQWQTDKTLNRIFINDIMMRARDLGMTPSILSSKSDWKLITGDFSCCGFDVHLWYYNVNSYGPYGETMPNINDYVPFGNFSDPLVKQYAQGENVCQLTVNRDVYVPSSPTSFIARKTPNKKGIIVGDGL